MIASRKVLCNKIMISYYQFVISTDWLAMPTCQFVMPTDWLTIPDCWFTMAAYWLVILTC